MHTKVPSKIMLQTITASVLLGLLSAGFISTPSGAANASGAAAPGPHSITSCTVSNQDNSVSQSVWRLEIPLDATSIPAAKLRMVPTPATGKYVFATAGFVKLDGTEFVSLGSGTGLATTPGYQPPGYHFDGDSRDVASVTVSQFSYYPQYPRSEWGYEYRWYATQGDVAGSQTSDTSVEPLCKITVVATDPVVSGQYAVTILEGTTAVGNFTASRSVTWSVIDYFGGDPLFQIPSGALAFRAPANPFPFGGTTPVVYQAPITATDADGNKFGGTVEISISLAEAPGTPGAPTATAGNGQATVQITPPTSGGSPLSYTVTASPGGATCSITSPATSCDVTGLTNGTAYTFTSRATNAEGTSGESASSNSVTPTAPSGPPDVGGSSKPFNGPVLSHFSTRILNPCTVTAVTITGSNLSGAKPTMQDKHVTVLENTDTKLVLAFPSGLTPANGAALVIKSASGTLTHQNAFDIASDSCADAGSKGHWTKMQSDGKTVKMYAKNPIGDGKIQFFVNGKEIAWINALDAADPKLSYASGNPYLVRSVTLQEGKNRFEIKLDGVRVWRATYVLKG